MSSAAANDVKTAVPIFDVSNYNVWVNQMKFWLQNQNLWRIVNSAILLPTVSPGPPPVTAQDVAVWDNKDEAAFGAISLRIAHHMWTAVFMAANTTSALVWTPITTTWSCTGISAIYQDYKAAIGIRVGMSNPAKDITRLQTHFECLSANNAPVSAYEQGMILLSAIPDKWDHVAAYYVQTCTSVANVSFNVIHKAILAEFDRSSGSHPDQSHVADKISAIKQKGKPPHFSKQKGADSSSANNDDGPSSSKKRHEHKKAKKAQGYSHHQSHVASMAMMVDQSANVQQQATVSRPMIALQPPRAGPSTTTVASFRPQGISYESKSLKQSAQAYTGQTGQPGPLTLTETWALISQLNLAPQLR